MPFSVTLLNTTTTDFAQVGMVCSCDPNGARNMPIGSAINVTMSNVTTHTSIGVSPTALLPIAVQT